MINLLNSFRDWLLRWHQKGLDRPQMQMMMGWRTCLAALARLQMAVRVQRGFPPGYRSEYHEVSWRDHFCVASVRRLRWLSWKQQPSMPNQMTHRSSSPYSNQMRMSSMGVETTSGYSDWTRPKTRTPTM